MTESNRTSEKRVHAMSMLTRVLCGQGGKNLRTSIVQDAKDKRYWSLVTCKRCLMYRKGADYER